MVSCAVRSCPSRDEVDKKETTGITFHRFPKNAERCHIWVKFVDRGNWQPTKYSVICSKHFSQKSFDRTSKCYVRLKQDAVPSIHLNQDEPRDEPPRAKIQVLSNIVLRPASSSSIVQPIAMPSTSASCEEVEMFSTPSTSSTRATTPVSLFSSSTNLDSSEITPRKRKLMKKLQLVQQVSNTRKKKIALLRKKILRKDKKISDMKVIVNDLQKKKFLEEESLDLISRLGGPQELYHRQSQKTLKKKLPVKYSEELKVFALTLNYYSPAAYKYVRRTFNTCLPHTRTISRWYQSLNGLPGFTSEAFNALRLKAAGSTSKILCALVMDEMAIRQHEEWVPSQGKSYGYVDMGTGSQETTVAKESLVLLLNSINGNWKIPVGYFLVAGITAEQKAGLVLECLRKCFEVGVMVVSLTFDGAPTNISMSNRLGCTMKHNMLKTTFQHPSCDENVAVFLDPSHMIKLVRNTLGDKSSFLNEKNELIEWRFFTQLHSLQESESFHLANKLRTTHIEYKKQKMKVRLATQLFSESVAKALKFCCEDLMLPEFENVGPTIEFTELINNVFDILNSRNLFQFLYKKPLSKNNYDQISTFLDKADKYIAALKTSRNGSLLLDSERHTGFLGLKVCISSTKFLYNSLVTQKQLLKFLPLYKISQDHLELFFCSIRSHGGHNNNPTSRQFQTAYKKLLVHVELRESFRGNCIPLEELTILKCNPIEHINVTSTEYLVYGVNLDCSSYIENDHDYLPDPISLYSKYIITYIAGYIVHYLKKALICEECIQALTSDTRDLFLFSFINLKNKKGLQYPSEDVIKITLKCEKFVKSDMLGSLPNSSSINQIQNNVLKEFLFSDVFLNLQTHSFNQSVFDSHRTLLIKSIINKYLNIRMTYLTKNRTKQADSIRHQSNKLVLFKGQ